MTEAQIFSRGYRHYQGERTGVRGAVRSVAWHSARTVLGIGRSARHKLLPIVIILFAYLPSIIFVGLSILIGSEILNEFIPPLSDTIGQVFFQVLLFASFVVPGVLVRDRRDGMLATYLSTPLERSSYILAKSIAIFGVLLVTTVGPALLQLIGFTFAGVGPEGGGAWLAALARVVGSGVFVAVVLGLVGMAASSLTDRPMFASVGIILLFTISGIAATQLLDAGYTSYFQGASLVDSTIDAVSWTFGDPVPPSSPPGWFSFVASSTWAAVGAAVVWLRYRKVVAIR